MKKIISIILILCLGALVGVGMDRYLSASSSHTETALEHARKHQDPNYVCPMHSEIVAAEPGSCPICGMD
ncbi:MAG TPA: efflux RND transporter periplasmic adaptor subunit, partial [Thiotrichales bacterium]|nr:efflux RND transporter periplasmic adaptor subunit [Thiotrichales bacterium]